MRRAFLGAPVVAVLLAACAVQVARPPEGKGELPAGFPAEFYQRLSERGSPVFQIDPGLSLIVIDVYRAGSLARLGHDHVIASHNVRGYVAPSEGRADFYVRLDELVVDEPSLRVAAGFDTQPTEAAIAGTRENMLRQLNTEQHPYAVIAIAGADAAAEGSLDAAIALHGITRTVKIPAKIEQGGEAVAVSGAVALEQTAFGIVPLSILGGGLQVQDRVDVHFAIQAHRVAP